MSHDNSNTTAGLVTGRLYPARANRLGEEVGWLDLTRTCAKCGGTEVLTIDERSIPMPSGGYCLTCWPHHGRRSPAPRWSIANG